MILLSDWKGGSDVSRHKYMMLLFFTASVLSGCGKQNEQATGFIISSQAEESELSVQASEQISAFDTAVATTDSDANYTDTTRIELVDVRGDGTDYTFEYAGTEYHAVYTPDNWKIIDSYQITDHEDQIRICEALKAIHPIHGADMVSFRDAEDMAYEWEQHNLAYQILQESNPYRMNAKDVDINPADQGKSMLEMYASRIGRS